MSPSLLDGGTFDKVREEFPETTQDARKLLKMVMKAVHNPEVQKKYLQGVQNNPGSTPKIAASMSAMLANKIMEGVERSSGAPMKDENKVIGLMMVIVSELIILANRLGGPPPNDELVEGTARMGLEMLDQFKAQQQQQGQPQGPQGQPQGPPQQGQGGMQ